MFFSNKYGYKDTPFNGLTNFLRIFLYLNQKKGK